jgi:preprotein translocase subunit SecD
MPEISTQDMVSFNPFPTEAGGDYGVVFALKENAARRFAAVTSANQGRWLVAVANGRVVDAVVIDKQVDDGMIVIWKDITLPDIGVFDETLPRTGEVNTRKKR